MTDYVNNITESGLSIYDHIPLYNHSLYIPTHDLEMILSKSLVGLSLFGLPLRSRSKKVKSEICRALGYPVPPFFRKTQPRFLGQNFDVYTQKSRNVQIWNEELDNNRRYVFLCVDQNDILTAVKVITGDELVRYDRTRTLTQKYQARMRAYGRNLCSERDSSTLEDWMSDYDVPLSGVNPNQLPQRGQLLRITEVFKRLLPIIGQTVDYLDAIQERNRGAELHRMICQHLGYSIYEDDGSYPDITNQLLEIKLQTSPTIDLGLHSPKDGKIIATISSTNIYSRDIRYAIFDGQIQGHRVLLRNLYLVAGVEFSEYFPLFQGRGINKKTQFSLPSDFFD